MNSKSFKRPYKPAGGFLDSKIPIKIIRIKNNKLEENQENFLNNNGKDLGFKVAIEKIKRTNIKISVK